MRTAVLLIDDDEETRSAIADFVVEAAFTIEQASDATSGLILAEQVEPDIVLLDLALPRHSGLDVLHRLKERHPTREIPVTIRSTYAMLLIRTDGELRTPFDLKDVLDYVSQTLPASATGGVP